MNTIDSLFNAILPFGPLSPALRNIIESKVIPLKRHRNYLLSKQGRRSNKLFFIQEGFASSWRIAESGKKTTTSFIAKSEFVACCHCLRDETAICTENIQLLEDSTILSINLEDFNELCKSHAHLNAIATRYAHHKMLQRLEQANWLRSYPPVKRLEHLNKMYPGILNIASNAQVASYLGESVNTLARSKIASLASGLQERL